MKTKSTVARRRVKRRQDRVSHKKLRTLRSRKYARKTARTVMRGGMTSAQLDDFIDDLGGDYDPSYRRSAPKPNYGTAYVVYDKIPTTLKKTVIGRQQIISKNVPICVVFIVDKTLKDDVYLFFNNRMTADEITTTVKLLLGMSVEDTFKLTPPIVRPKEPEPMKGDLDDLWSVTGMFVKISGCWANQKYCVHSGIILDKNTLLDKIKTTEHEITTTNKTYNGMNGDKIQEHIKNTDNGFKNRLLKAVLPELYKKYFVEAKPEYTPDELTKKEASEEAVKLYGPDIEWSNPEVEEEGKKKPIKNWKITYPEFKQSKIKEIEETILDKKRHKTYGFNSTAFNMLTQKRPLEITSRMSISYLKIDPKTIFDAIIVDDGFTSNENWWEGLEANNLIQKVNEVQEEKKDRVDWCSYDPNSRDCLGDAWN